MNNSRVKLQLAVDVLSIAEALKKTEQVYPHFDILETGTPLIIEEGLRALEVVKEKYPGKTYLADLKIMDAGSIEATSGFVRGADIVTVLAAADDQTIQRAVESAVKHGGLIMADLINVPEPISRAVTLEKLGVHIICLHTAFDVQDQGGDSMGYLEEMRSCVNCDLAIAGGLKLENIEQAVTAGADIVVVGGGIISQEDPQSTAAKIRNKIAEVYKTNATKRNH